MLRPFCGDLAWVETGCYPLHRVPLVEVFIAKARGETYPRGERAGVAERIQQVSLE